MRSISIEFADLFSGDAPNSSTPGVPQQGGNDIADLKKRCDLLEQQLTRLTAELKTYQFMATRLLVEQRETNDRIDELEGVCAALTLSSSIKAWRKRNETQGREE